MILLSDGSAVYFPNLTPVPPALITFDSASADVSGRFQQAYNGPPIAFSQLYASQAALAFTDLDGDGIKVINNTDIQTTWIITTIFQDDLKCVLTGQCIRSSLLHALFFLF